MSNLTNAELESMQNSEAAAVYIVESLFSNIFELDGTAEVMISESIKKGCPHFWKDANYRIVSNRLFDWWMQNMPYIYLALLEDKTFTSRLYDGLVKVADCDHAKRLDAYAYNEDGSARKSVLAEDAVFHVDFTNFNDALYKKLLTDLEESMHSLDAISDRIDDFANNLTPAKRQQISYIVCNFMYLVFELMHNNALYNWMEAISRYYQEMVPAHAAAYDEAADNPGDFA